MTTPRRIKLNDFEIGNDLPFVLLAGPCAMESEQHAMDRAGELIEITKELNIPFVFKSSFDKANRSSVTSARGVGMEYAMDVFDKVKKEYGCPVVTDIHLPEHAAQVAPHVDIIQIPAFLARQTDLLVAAGETGKIINVKKPQFLASWNMKEIVGKIESTGNTNIMLTDRGTSFGYGMLVSDFRGLPIMADTGCPVVMDATHSVQMPSSQGTTSGGQREFVSVLARAAAAVGIGALFIECHEDPDKAPCDGPNMIAMKDMKEFLEQIKSIDDLRKSMALKGY